MSCFDERNELCGPVDIIVTPQSVFNSHARNLWFIVACIELLVVISYLYMYVSYFLLKIQKETSPDLKSTSRNK